MVSSAGPRHHSRRRYVQCARAEAVFAVRLDFGETDTCTTHARVSVVYTDYTDWTRPGRLPGECATGMESMTEKANAFHGARPSSACTQARRETGSA